MSPPAAETSSVGGGGGGGPSEHFGGEGGDDAFQTPLRSSMIPPSSTHSTVSALTADSTAGGYGMPPRHPRSTGPRGLSSRPGGAGGAGVGGAGGSAAERDGIQGLGLGGVTASMSTTATTTVDGIPLPQMTAYTPLARTTARTRALTEAEAVTTSEGYVDGGYLDSFNLLGVVSNPRHGAGIMGDLAAIASSHSHEYGEGGGYGHGGGGGGGSPRTRARKGSMGSVDIPRPFSAHGQPACGARGGGATPPSAAAASAAQSASASQHAAQTPANGTTPASSALSAATGLDMSSLADLEHTVTEGLHDLSDTINTVNSYFSTFSSYYLGSGILLPSAEDDFAGELEYDGLEDEVISVQLSREELRDELRNVDLASVENYLRRCGGLAWRFDSRRGESELINVGDNEESRHGDDKRRQEEEAMGTEEEGEGQGGSVAAGSDSRTSSRASGGRKSKSPQSDDDDGDDAAEAEADPTLTVPEIFFSPYFDLTDPHTFESLLVVDESDQQDDGAPSAAEKQNGDKDEGGGQPSKADAEDDDDAAVKPKLMSIHPTESLSANLDTIELALLNQVRSKSSSFFRETNRFSYLQNQVAECVSDVKVLRGFLGDIRERTVTDVELIPIMDRKRRELRLLGAVLDEVQDVVEVKGSVAGLIAAGDYVGAVGAIRSARGLLRGDKKHKTKEGDEAMKVEEKDEDKMTPTERAEAEAAEAALNYPLARLAAMSKVDDQLNQYEQLVVNDLANELVETFLAWEDGSSSAGGSSLLSTGPFSLGGGVGRRARTREVVKALALCHKLDYAADLYKTKLSEVVRVTVRTTVTECAADALAELERRKSKKIAAAATEGGAEEKQTQGKSSVTAGVTSMTFDQFLSCLDMLFEQILSLLKGAVSVNKFLREEGIVLRDERDGKGEGGGEVKAVAQQDAGDASAAKKKGTATPTALTAAADLSHKSISELLRLRKESHSLITFDEMKRLWDTCLSFTLSIERSSGQKAYGLRSTLLTQAKAFVERRHEANMASLVSALDGERWNQCDVSPERQAALDRLCSGRAVLSGQQQSALDPSNGAATSAPVAAAGAKLAEADVEGKRYKVVWSCLLLVEMVMSNVACAAHFQTLATNVVGKVCELLRLFNSRTTQLVLGAGAIHSAARLKSINAKHLSLVTQCLGLVVTILPHVRAALMAQLPSKQHNLLLELDKIKKEYGEHNEKVLSKLVSIIGGIIERGLAPRICKIDFDARAKSMPTPSVEEIKSPNYENSVTCCQFLDGISANARKMHQVLVVLLPPEDLVDVFSRIFAYVDTKVPSLFLAAVAEGEKQAVAAAKAAAEAASQKSQQGGTVVAIPPQPGPAFKMPSTEAGKLRMILEVDSMSRALNRLPNVQAWDFTATRVLERELEVSFGLNAGASPPAAELPISNGTEATPTGTNAEDLHQEEGAAKPNEDAEEATPLQGTSETDETLPAAGPVPASEEGVLPNGNDAIPAAEEASQEEPEGASKPDEGADEVTQPPLIGEADEEAPAPSAGEGNDEGGTSTSVDEVAPQVEDQGTQETVIPTSADVASEGEVPATAPTEADLTKDDQANGLGSQEATPARTNAEGEIQEQQPEEAEAGAAAVQEQEAADAAEIHDVNETT